MSLLLAEGLARHYRVAQGPFRRATLRALDGVSFTLDAARTLAVVGESGCGKSTLARLVAMLERPSAGSAVLDGVDLAGPRAGELRRAVQMVFQDPYGSLDPRRSIFGALAEPLVVQGVPAAERRARIAQALSRVGLRPELGDRYPHMFSGGQRQRIAIARALITGPRLVVADEPVSALDVSIRAQILNLLLDLQQQLGLAYLFISHDLSVVRHIADAVMVMYLGRAVEHGARDAVFSAPRHPYTMALLAATPQVDPARRAPRRKLAGELPSPLAPPPGCAFHRRCPHATERCAIEVPRLRAVDGRLVACHHAEHIAA